MTESFLHPRWVDPAARAELAARWRQAGNLRLEPFLGDEQAERLLAALRAQPFELRTAPPGSGFRFLYWQHAFRPEPACDHQLCAFGRWLFGPARAWLSELTQLELVAPAHEQVVATLYGRGSYLDPHNDYDGRRQVAYVLGLSPESWPAAAGGHLEFLNAGPEAVRVAERRPPGWNTLDLFDVRQPTRPHRVPLLREHRERRAVSGWFLRAGE